MTAIDETSTEFDAAVKVWAAMKLAKLFQVDANPDRIREVVHERPGGVMDDRIGHSTH